MNLNNFLIPGQIQSASVTEPAQRESLTYSAVSYEVIGEGIIGAIDEYPINTPLPITANDPAQFPNIVPAQAGDPCLFIKVIGGHALIVLTERLDIGPCPESGA